MTIIHALPLLVGREPDGDAGGADSIDDGRRNLDKKADTVLDRAAIFIGSEIGVVAQELVDQIAIGAMDLDAVETRLHRVPSRRGIVGYRVPNIVVSHRLGLDIRLLAFVRPGETRHGCRRRR